VELLEDEPDPPRAHARQLALGGGRDVGARDHNLAARRAFERPHDVQQRRLP
jgi:hypothetical protein